jgi:glycosyltransferase involved in cell wall biosynthesis
VQLHEVMLRRMRDPRVLFTCLPLNRLVRAFRPDVLHLQETAPLYSSGTLLAMRREMPVVLTVHDPRTHSGESPSHGLRWEALLYLRRRATRVIVHGPRMHEEMEALDPCFAGRVDAIPHGALGAEGGTEAPDSDAAVGSIDAHAGMEPVSFLFFGRVQRYKGLQYFLEAGEILQRRGHAMRLIVAGTGADLARHRERIAASPWVELIDRHIAPAEVAPLFRRASVVVLPYTDATQSGVAAMAFAHGRPVISTRVGDLPEVVIEGRTGRLVAPCNGQELADAMEQLLRDAPLRQALGIGAAEFAASEISWGRIAEMSVGTYRRAIAAGK